MVTDIVVFCADIGSVAKGNFGWAVSIDAEAPISEHREIGDLAVAVAAALLRSGWTTDISLLSEPCIVVRPSDEGAH